MLAFYRSSLISLCLFLGAVALYFSTCSLGKKKEHLIAENTFKAELVRNLQKIKTPENYIKIVLKERKKDIPKQLKSIAQKHHILISKMHQFPNHKIEITLQGELDTDVFAYLQDLSEEFPNTLSLQEIGLFREGNHVIGKVAFETFFERTTQ